MFFGLSYYQRDNKQNRGFEADGSGTHAKHHSNRVSCPANACFLDGQSRAALTRSLSSFPGLKWTVNRAGTATASPVFGLRPTTLLSAVQRKPAEPANLHPLPVLQSEANPVGDRQHRCLDFTCWQVAEPVGQPENEFCPSHRLFPLVGISVPSE